MDRWLLTLISFPFGLLCAYLCFGMARRRGWDEFARFACAACGFFFTYIAVIVIMFTRSADGEAPSPMSPGERVVSRVLFVFGLLGLASLILWIGCALFREFRGTAR